MKSNLIVLELDLSLYFYIYCLFIYFSLFYEILVYRLDICPAGFWRILVRFFSSPTDDHLKIYMQVSPVPYQRQFKLPLFVFFCFFSIYCTSKTCCTRIFLFLACAFMQFLDYVNSYDTLRRQIAFSYPSKM